MKNRLTSRTGSVRLLAALALAAVAVSCSSNNNSSSSNKAAAVAAAGAAATAAAATSTAPPSAAATTAPATAAAAATQAAKASLTVQLNFIPNVEHYAISYAAKEGLYDKENLKVTVAPGGQGLDPIKLVAAGGAQIGVGSAEDLLTAYSQGIKLKAFAVEFQKSPISLTCRKDSGVTKIADIAGKKLGLKANAEDLFNTLLKKNNIDRTKLDIVPVGASSVTELIAGTIQCQFTTFSVNEPNSMRKNGVEPVVMLIADNGLASQSNVYFTAADQYDKNKDALTRWVRATSAGWQNFLKDPRAAAKYVVDKAFVDGLDLDQQTAQAISQADLITSDLTKQKGLMWIDPEIWKQTAQNLYDAKTTPTVVDPANVITTELLEAAAK